ncbi:copper homeostasis protein CutC [Pararhizobium sp. O133]|uniref:copper homeostasis protein CutC n=1 Tax=Pararhizobium sp. O133 TaxID=3449278 RepID=UPI003F682663
MTDILLEVCVEDAAGLAAAVAGGADRIELCSALSVGGLTPSAGLMALAAKVAIPVYAMIRPHAGDFVFRADDLDIMCGDIDAARSAGLAGVVLGASLADGRLDVAALEHLSRRANGLGITLHRAFDLVPDFAEAVEIAVTLGFERILTSGGARTAAEGIEALAEIIRLVNGRLSIMPGSGVTIDTVGGMLERLAVNEVHSSCSRSEPAKDDRLVSLGFVASSARMTNAGLVRALKARLDAAR